MLSKCLCLPAQLWFAKHLLPWMAVSGEKLNWELVGLPSSKRDIDIIPTIMNVQEHRGKGGKNVRAGGWDGILGDAVV